MAHISIYLTNLGKYNEGELVGEWVDLPIDDEELQEVFQRIGIGSVDEFGRPYEEYFITDYETDIPGLSIDEYDNLIILYQGADTVQDLGYAMVDLFGGLESLGDETLKDNFDFESYGRDFRLQWTPSSWIDNVEDDADIDIYDYFGVSDDKELGEYVVYDIDGGLEALGNDALENYFDYEGYAQGFINSGIGEFTEDGFIEDTGR